MSNTLKPCPFCGDMPDYHTNKSGITIRCMSDKCGVYVYTEGRATKAIARKSWNTRTNNVQQEGK